MLFYFLRFLFDAAKIRQEFYITIVSLINYYNITIDLINKGVQTAHNTVLNNNT